VEIPSDSDSDASSDSEIVELSALNHFCNIFKKAQDLEWDQHLQEHKSTCPKTYTGRSKRTLAQRQQEQRIARANGSQFITDFFQSTQKSLAQVPVPTIHLEDEESSGSERIEELEDPKEHFPVLLTEATTTSLQQQISEARGASCQGCMTEEEDVAIDQGVQRK